MRINYIRLENFASIYSGMECRNIAIDLSKSKNRIILLLGANGSGKTSLLSNLHPFAYPGNMDSRNGTDLILEDYDGYKEIHLEHNDDNYIIKHSYKKSSNGRIVKSYIIKNKLELNGNGNVTSFKDILLTEFGLEMEFLKLLRLGSNVSSLITMKTTDRKKFSSNLLSDIDIYTDLYKKINGDYRLLTSKIKSVSDKINKLKIDDEDEAIEKLNDIEKILVNLNRNKEEVMLLRGASMGKINSLYSGSVDDLINEINSNSFKVVEIQRQNQKFKKHIENSKFNESKINKLKDSFTKELNKKNQEHAVLCSKIDMKMVELNSLFEQKQKKENDLRFIDSDSHVNNLINMKQNLIEEIDELNSSLENFNSTEMLTKEETLIIINMLNDIRGNIVDIISLDIKGELIEFLKMVSSNVNIESAIGKKVKVLEESILIKNMQMGKESSNDIGKNDLKVLYQLCDRDDCPFVEYYKQTTTELETDKDRLQKEINKLDTKRVYYLNILEMNKCYNIIKYVMSMSIDTIKRSVCKDNLNSKLINKSLCEKTTTYIDKLIESLTLFITFIEDSMELKEKESKLKEIDKEIVMIKNNSKSLDLLKSDLDNILNKMNDSNKDIVTMREAKDQLDLSILDIQSSLDELDLILSYNDKILENESVIKLLNKENDSLVIIKDKILDENQKMLLLQKQENSLVEQIKYHNEQRDFLTYRLKEYNQLKTELNQLSLKYEDVDILKKSLSNDKGMPLLLMQLYLKNARKNVNELLNMVYGDKLELENLVINENEFRIPYSKNGIIVDDVIRASQGETSFISLALSFSLIEQSIKKYNVLLLDEVDGPLDQDARPIFLSILEKYLDKINAEQVFMTTHNNAFDNYEVDAICTSKNTQIDNFKNVNIVFSI